MPKCDFAVGHLYIDVLNARNAIKAISQSPATARSAFFLRELISFFVDLCKSIRWCVIFHRRRGNEKKINASLKIHRSILSTVDRRRAPLDQPGPHRRRIRQSRTKAMEIIIMKKNIYFQCRREDATHESRFPFFSVVLGPHTD